MNTGQIVKSKSFEIPYTQISNDILRNQNLSYEEKGLMCSLLSLPSDWVIYKTNLHEIFGEKKSTTDRVFKSLQNKGYILSVKSVDESGRFKGWNHIVYHEPILVNQIQEKPTSGNPEVGKSTPILNKESTTKERKEYILVDLEIFMQYWALYDRKEGLEQAKAEWAKLTDKEKTLIAAHAPKFVANRERAFRPKPEKYLREKMFLDEIVPAVTAAKKKTVNLTESEKKIVEQCKITPVARYSSFVSASASKQFCERAGYDFDAKDFQMNRMRI